jgi:hypothetical protein
MTNYGTHSLDTEENERSAFRDFLQAKGIEKPSAAQIDAAMRAPRDPYLAALRAAGRKP